MMIYRPLLSAALFGMALAIAGGCATTGQETTTATPEAEPGAEPGAEPEGGAWGYVGESGPARWGDLSADYAACREGRLQSPVNLRETAQADLPELVFDYELEPLMLGNNGHTLQMNFAPGSMLRVGGDAYQLVQFHFHVPAEHLLRGEPFPMAIHMVHQSEGGDLAVVGLLVQRGAANPVFAPLFEDLPGEKGASRRVTSDLDAEALLPEEKDYFTYPGSLTTPPCTEGVRWIVLEEPIEASPEQIKALSAVIGGSNRPIQPLGPREVQHEN